MKIFYLWAVISIFSGSIAFAAGNQSGLLMGNTPASEIIANNRVLAKIHGKPVTVIDVMKKMDMLFFRQFPEYATLTEARFQYYQINWRFVLQDLIDKELMLLDAEESKLETSHGDVRQEMEQMLGPNIIANLDKAGLSLEEATKMVKTDITIRRVLMMRTHAKAQKAVTPQALKEAYAQFEKDPKNIQPPTWDYRVISIRDTESSQGAAIAALLYQSLSQKGDGTVSLEEKVKSIVALDPSASVNISEEFHHNDSEISPSYKEVLDLLSVGDYSKPIEQKSRSQKGVVYRIFFLKDKKAGGVPSFSDVEAKLKESLTQNARNKETELYLNSLRTKYHLDAEHLKTMIPENFQPFVLR